MTFSVEMLLRNLLAAASLVFILAVGLTFGWVGGNMNAGVKAASFTSTKNTATVRSPAPAVSKVVNLEIVPDLAGPGYDAFVIASNLNGTIPSPATNDTGPGVNDNNVTLPAGVSVTFVITNLDTALLLNFSGPASTDFTIYNATEDGQVASHYTTGQPISELPISHTFTIQSLNINIPVPPDTVVTFTYTFHSPGVYQYLCETPCGPGMGLVGYMSGFLIVT